MRSELNRHPVRLDADRFRGKVDGRQVRWVALQSDHLQASWCNHGARLLELWVPDDRGQWRDVVLGYDHLQQLLNGMPSMGAFIGRYANRIGHARYGSGADRVQLPANDGPHCLHGGPGGSRHRVFELTHASADHIGMAWTFRSEDDGFPGDVELQLQYRLLGSTLRIDHQALVLRASTPLSLTAHPFFNLDGEPPTSISGHVLQIHAQRYVPVDAQRIPLGALSPVQGTRFDFRKPRPVGSPHVGGSSAVPGGPAPL
jgi:aldose 1-epimerase